jgi:hypothetical protein
MLKIIQPIDSEIQESNLKLSTNRKFGNLKNLTKAIAAAASIPIAGIIAMSGAGSAFALSCPAGYVTAVAANGAQFCSPTGTGGVAGGGTATIGNGASTVPGQAAPIVGGGTTAPQLPPAYNPPPAYVPQAPAAPAQQAAQRPAAPAPAQVQAPVAPAGQVEAPASNAEAPSIPQEAPAAVTPETGISPEPSKAVTDTPSTVASSAPVNNTASIAPSSFPTAEATKAPVAVTQAASVSPLNLSLTAGAGLVAFLLLAMTIAGHISFAKVNSKELDNSENS